MTTQDAGVLAVIAARGGSKALPRKNVLPLGGRPLIAWSVRVALEAACVGRVIVTTDDTEIAEVARAAGAEVPFMRPAELASDTATSADVMAHAIGSIPGHQEALLLQPTSPFRTAPDIDRAHALWRTSGAPSCVSVCEAIESPWLMFARNDAGRLRRLLAEPPGGLRRQDLPRAYQLNGALYFVRAAQFLVDHQFLHAGTVGFEMPLERSIDIDTAADLDDARRRLDRWGGKVPGASV